jgi:inner membrane protein
MTGRTHITLGAAAGLLIAAHFNYDPVLCFAAGCLGGLLPDIDHPQSMLSGWVPGSGLLGVFGVRHRGFTHSVLFAVLLVAAWFFATAQQISVPYPLALALLTGVATHLLSDMLTPQGIQLLYPARANFKAAPGFVLSVGKWFGIVELIVWLAGLAGIAVGIYLIVTPQ